MRLHELFEGKVKNAAIDADYNRIHAKPITPEFGIMISGKIWNKGGKPVSFKTRELANKAVYTLALRKNITCQVVPL
jgi:hypothetical protein